MQSELRVERGRRRVDLTGGKVAGHPDNSEWGAKMSDRDGLAASLSLISSQPSLLRFQLLQVVFPGLSATITMATTSSTTRHCS